MGGRWFGDCTNSSLIASGLGSSSSDEWLGEVIVTGHAGDAGLINGDGDGFPLHDFTSTPLLYRSTARPSIDVH